MSKSKDKQHSREDEEKKRSFSAGHEPAPGGENRTVHRSPSDEGGTTDAPSPERFPLREAASAGQVGGQATDLTPGDGQPPVAQTTPLPTEADGQADKMAQLHDRLLRLQADFDNFRKRTLREKNELFDNANQALMLELLPVLDHLHLGVQATSTHQVNPAFREGLSLILDQLMGVLSKFGLSPIATENQRFDTSRFEAVNSLPSATAPEGTVLTLIRPGYMLRNKLLRPAQVIVSSGPPPEGNKIKNAE